MGDGVCIYYLSLFLVPPSSPSPPPSHSLSFPLPPPPPALSPSLSLPPSLPPSLPLSLPFFLIGSISWLMFQNGHLFSASEDGTIVVWKCSSWEPQQVFSGRRSLSIPCMMTRAWLSVASSMQRYWTFL